MKKKVKQETVALVDADIVVFRAAVACQQSIVFGGYATARADLQKGYDIIDSTISRVMDVLNAGRAVLALSDPSGVYFRHALGAEYKAARPDKQKPIARGPLLDYVYQHYTCVWRQGLEGDDVLGILASGDKIRGYEGTRRIVVTIDKDLRNVPCLLNLSLSENRVEKISEEQADYWLCHQTLCGDRVDGYAGCPSIGPIKAGRVLQDAVEGVKGREERLLALWAEVVNRFLIAGSTLDEAVRQARFARILRASDYDFSTKTVKLWEPPSLEGYPF